jgi:hypothetical protein
MITPQQAIARYPQLGAFLVLTTSRPAWLFRCATVSGHVEALRGTRVWADGTVDQIGIRDQADAAGRRVDPAGSTVWMQTGTVGEIAGKVIEQLLPPSHPLAPRRPLSTVIAVPYAPDVGERGRPPATALSRRKA